MSLIKIEKSVVKPSNKISKAVKLSNIIIQTASDGTVILKNTDGAQISSTPVSSGQIVNITAPNGEIRIERTDGTIIGGGNQEVPSDGVDTFVVPDSQYQVLNSDNTEVLFGTTPAQRFLSLDFPDTPVNIVDQFGNPIKSENVASGNPQNIEVNIAQSLYIYPYDELNTGQNVSYATGDDKDIRDTVFTPEINSWPTDRPLVKPILDLNDTTKLFRGSNPDGSGNNIFGNKERYTDYNGLQIYADGLKIDHYTGLTYKIDDLTLELDFQNAIAFYNNLIFQGYNDWHLPNFNEAIIPFNFGNASFLGDTLPILRFVSSTSRSAGLYIRIRYNEYNFSLVAKTQAEETYGVRKAFTYNPTTQQMELS